MAVVTEEHVKKLVSHTLKTESEQRSSSECYPLYTQSLYYLFYKLNADCGSQPIPDATLRTHESLLNLAKKLIDESQKHVSSLRGREEFSRESLPKMPVVEASPVVVRRDRTHSKESPPHVLLPKTSPSVGSIGKRDGLMVTGKTTWLLRDSWDREGDRSLTAYAPLNMEHYRTFLPPSPVKKAESEIRRLQARFEANEQRLCASRGTGAAATTTRHLTLDRKKSELLEIAKRNMEIYLNDIRQQALKVCNDSVQYFRYYKEHFSSPHLQLLLRQAMLYSLFHLQNHPWYQKMVAGKRSAERCLAFLIRDPRHPLVQFIIQMAARYLVRLKDKDDIDAVASDLKDELQKVAEILTLIIRRSHATQTDVEMNEDEAEDLLPMLSCALYSQTADGQEMHHTALRTIRASLSPDLEAIKRAMALSGSEQRAITEVDTSLLAATHEQDLALFSVGRDLVRDLGNKCCPFEKLQVMHRAASTIVDASMRVSGRESARDLGADEIQPLMTYVVLCWQEPDLLVHCIFLDKFALGKPLLGIEGYSLVSLQSAVLFFARREKEDDDLTNEP